MPNAPTIFRSKINLRSYLLALNADGDRDLERHVLDNFRNKTPFNNRVLWYESRTAVVDAQTITMPDENGAEEEVLLISTPSPQKIKPLKKQQSMHSFSKNSRAPTAVADADSRAAAADADVDEKTSDDGLKVKDGKKASGKKEKIKLSQTKIEATLKAFDWARLDEERGWSCSCCCAEKTITAIPFVNGFHIPSNKINSRMKAHEMTTSHKTAVKGSERSSADKPDEQPTIEQGIAAQTRKATVTNSLHIDTALCLRSSATAAAKLFPHVMSSFDRYVGRYNAQIREENQKLDDNSVGRPKPDIPCRRHQSATITRAGRSGATRAVFSTPNSLKNSSSPTRLRFSLTSRRKIGE